jgi:hypothetical protein
LVCRVAYSQQPLADEEIPPAQTAGPQTLEEFVIELVGDPKDLHRILPNQLNFKPSNGSIMEEVLNQIAENHIQYGGELVLNSNWSHRIYNQLGTWKSQYLPESPNQSPNTPLTVIPSDNEESQRSPSFKRETSREPVD